MAANELQDVLDEERGRLDRRHGQSCGWSGPASAAYLRGFGTEYDAQARLRTQHEHANAHIDHGWHT